HPGRPPAAAPRAARDRRIARPCGPLARAGGASQPRLPLGLHGEPARALLLRREAPARFDPRLARLLPGHVPRAGATLEPPLPCRWSVGLSRAARRPGARTRRRPDRGLGRGGAR